MAGKLKHKFTSPKSDGPDATLVRPSNWNDSLVMSEGSDNQVLMRDAGQPDGWSLATLSTDLSVSGASGARTLTIPLLRKPNAGHLFGLTCSNNATDATNDIDIAVGEALSDDALDANREFMELLSGLTKQLDATWAVGTNAGMRDSTNDLTGAKTFHVFLIKRTDTGVVDVFASTSLSPVLPNDYTKKRRIGSILWSGSTIRGFTQDGDEFLFKTVVDEGVVANPGTAAVLRTLTVPTGIKVRALVALGLDTGSIDNTVYVSSPDVDDQAAVFVGGAGVLGIVGTQAATTDEDTMGWVVVRTNTSGQIRTRHSASSASVDFQWMTLGWYDRRGRDAA
jgi:hypothetical protein